MELVRTNEVMTAGITNIPLTYPAYIFFTFNKEAELRYGQTILNDYQIPSIAKHIKTTNKYFLKSSIQIESKKMKQIWRNFKSLHPKFDSEYRYCFWEIDDRTDAHLNKVVDVYRYLNLPVYIHKSMKGYHFLSVKPVAMDIFKWFVSQVRITNENYPPITLRIKPNKYIKEEQEFFEGFIMASAYHKDTEKLRDMIVNQDFIAMGEQYQLVWYSLDKKVSNKEEIIQT